MTIYTSEKVMPYVYMGTHKETGEFYIGSRSGARQKLPSHEDIYQYRTSSKKVKPIFDQFDWVIVAEFLDPTSAYEYEQSLIYEHWDNKLKLNSSCYYGKRRLSTAGRVMSAEQRAKISAANKGKKRTEEQNKKQSERTKGMNSGPRTEEQKQRMREASADPVSRQRRSESAKKRALPTDETRRKISESNKRAQLGNKRSVESIQKQRDTIAAKKAAKENQNLF